MVVPPGCGLSASVVAQMWQRLFSQVRGSALRGPAGMRILSLSYLGSRCTKEWKVGEQ